MLRILAQLSNEIVTRPSPHFHRRRTNKKGAQKDRTTQLFAVDFGLERWKPSSLEITSEIKKRRKIPSMILSTRRLANKVVISLK